MYGITLEARPPAPTLPPVTDHPFHPSREAALAALSEFMPRAGRTYAEGRNFDHGPGRRDAVSQLSPYLRHRLITEEDVLRAVLDRHTPDAASRFVTEVFWRTYWKGWLEMRPSVWTAYRAGLGRAWNDVQTQSGLRGRWEDACAGETGIDCFDAWARELAETGYLHNHARMWFASIWIFTLGLPWELGADFFLRHLLDGDPASNTLSWRWVAGLQTRGKHYVATAENIAEYTGGRFRPAPGELNEDAASLDGPPHPERIAAPERARIDLRDYSALILHIDDLSPDWLLDDGLTPLVTFVLAPPADATPLRMSDRVQDFRRAALESTVRRLSSRLGRVVSCADAGALKAAVADLGAARAVTPYASVGPVAEALAEVPAERALRPYDARAWPHATAGFFKFRKHIPALLAATRGIEVV
jgi:deoxyribodipyrimidine photo-lyase